MTRVHNVVSAGRIALIGLVSAVLLQGCTTLGEQRELVCGVKDGGPGGKSVPFGAYLTKAEVSETIAEGDRGGGILPPGGCTTQIVSGTTGEASGWLELDPATNKPTGNTAPSNATCILNNAKCKFPNTQTCTKVGGGSGKCRNAIYRGDYNQRQPCTCFCN